MPIIANDHTISLDEDYRSSIIPSRHMELNRKVILSGNAYVKGGVYGDVIQINAGNITVEESMYTPFDLTIDLQQKSLCHLNSP